MGTNHDKQTTEDIPVEGVMTDNEQELAENTGEREVELPVDLRQELEELKDKYLRLMAEYDNHRKRTMKEKAELIRNAAERTLRELLPVVDDFDLALSHVSPEAGIDAMQEGLELIHKKLTTYLAAMGVAPITTEGGVAFDENFCEAIALVPAPTPEQKGLIIDCTLKGYMLNDKVLRYAKVVVGQ